MSNIASTQAWFALGERVPYDPRAKRILRPGATDAAEAIQVYQRVVRNGAGDEAVWTTFLPGFPDGSFGWVKVDKHLGGNGTVPKLYVDSLGRVTQTSRPSTPTARWSAPTWSKRSGRPKESGPPSS